MKKKNLDWPWEYLQQTDLDWAPSYPTSES